ncbi:cellulose synthase/poly-beta-1,6-N-acetylglucosamine synthase-like glycosyltransferase [Mucilaginibacter yixingensis]|uniref:Cellulose synthase/poly-beta-1,6-N-acetylglucosamine synthase-like glycosyltransferase n=1 Tax=Mucilaginibacter yixingensis TaxID=1295612 RepID=A0A2T5JG53_9SPHI|nr:glycosyltransferase [Mucilaginibacter yixingensis]PTR01346.1 cellulose synthase/poly-beta-1,6-N-acetylglucosamine synthase-like glycosyltransferase [Mucilaginibacter yixingensis]
MEPYLHAGIVVLVNLFFIIQVFFLVGRYNRLSAYKIKTDDNETPTIPVSVIIAARNEARNLSEYLPSILEQDYPDFEVVVINDCSYDGSDMLLMDMEQKYPRLKVVTVTEHDRFKTGKKFALTMGIKAAKHEHMLFTDADCKPATDQWIRLMTRNFEQPGTEIVLGYSPYVRKRGLMNLFIRFETVKTGMSYLAAALHHDAYMGIGRNLAYTKTLFFKSKGFASHMHILSGDDDLFVNQNATSTNVQIEIDKRAFTYSQAKTTYQSWYRQKKRHMGVGKLYRNGHRRLLTADAMSGFLFYIMLIISFSFKVEPLLALSLYLLRLGIQLAVYIRIFRKLRGKDLLFFLPFLDLFYYFYLNIFGLIGHFIKTTQWK